MKCTSSCLLLVCLAVPVTAFGNSMDFANSGGTLSGSGAGLSLSGSTLILAAGPSILLTGNLGSVTFSTAALSGGSVQSGSTFAAGGSFVITGNGTGGISNGVIFNGTFSGPVTWAFIPLSNGTHDYTLTGALSGTWFTGASVVGATIQLTINTGKGFFNGSTLLSSGDTNITGNGLALISTPEPTTQSLLGTWLLGLAGLWLCKFRR